MTDMSKQDLTHGLETPVPGAPMHVCPSCESSAVTEASVTETFEYGCPESVPLTVTQPVMTCNKCQESWTDYRGEQAREAAVERYKRVFAPSPTTSITEIERRCEDALVALYCG